jgi:pilus assembly protein Flp/PilA
MVCFSPVSDARLGQERDDQLMECFMRVIISYFNDESGASAAEYALILGIIAAAIVVAVGTLGTDISASITHAAGQIPNG